MEYGQVQGITKPVSRLVQGRFHIDPDRPEACCELFDAVLACGCNTFDTAHIYGRGDEERALGAWIERRGIRDQVVIITKGAHQNADRNRVTPVDISSDLHDSLARLRVASIDLYMLHRDDPGVPVEPIVEALNAHLAAGRIHAFGASNWTHQRIEEANAYAAAHDLVPFAASSPQFSLAEMVRAPWAKCVSIGGPGGSSARAWYRQTGMPVFAWSSMAGGFFSGRFRPDNLATFTAKGDRLCIEGYAYPENFARLERAALLARELDVSVPQLALAYVLSQPLDTYALVACRSGAEMAENHTALRLRLTPAQLAWLDAQQEGEPA
jgi:aryl-alcohol dehydrogenase-like predicted oxidoreductase